MMQVPDLPHPVTGVLLAATAWTYYSKGEPALIAISFTGPAVLSLVVLPILSGLQQARWANRGRALMAMAFALCGLAYAWDAHQGKPSEQMQRSGWVHALVSLLSSHASKGHAAGTLPLWARCLIGLACCYGKTYAMAVSQGFTTAAQVIACFALQFVADIVLPLLLYKPQRAEPACVDASDACDSVGGSHLAACPAASSALARARPSSQSGKAASLTRPPSNENVKVPLQPYQSVLGERMTINIKIGTRHHPEDLQPNALNNLARLVERFEMQDGRPLADVALGAAVRRGCILIALEISRHRVAATGTRSRQPVSAADALAYAQEVLPRLHAELGLNADHRSSCSSSHSGWPQLGSAEYLQIQLGPHIVRATVRRGSQQWLFQLRPAEDDAAAALRSIQLCLAQPQLLPLARDAVVPSGLHAVSFTVHVRHSHVLCGLPLHGSDPSQNVDDSARAIPQLWVHCQDQYVRTVVHGVDGYTGTVQATAYVPAAVLARHHQPDGPAARLQLLTVELWHGSRTVSRTRLLLDAAQHMQPAVPDSSFGWWGTSAEQAAGLVAEIGSLAGAAAAAAADSGDEAAVDSYEAFVSDLAVWLQAVQQAAPATCCDMCRPQHGVQAMGALTAEQLSALSASLQTHAAQDDLPRVLVFLQRTQQATGLGTQPNLHAAAGSWSSQVAAAWQQLQLWVRQITRSSCKECDKVFYAGLKCDLGRMPACMGVVRGLVCLMAFAQPTAQSVYAILAWALITALHMAATAWVLPSVLSSKASSPHLSHSVSLSLTHPTSNHMACFLLPYAAYTYALMFVFTGAVPTKAHGLSIGCMAALTAMQCVLGIMAHQVPSWRIVSSKISRALSSIDMCVWLRLTYRAWPYVPLWFISYTVAVYVLLPHGLYLYGRRKYTQRYCATPTRLRMAGRPSAECMNDPHSFPCSPAESSISLPSLVQHTGCLVRRRLH